MNSTIKPTELERAFQLARSGEHPNASRIRDQLRKEGFAGTQIEGASLCRQLNELCRKSGAQVTGSLPSDDVPSPA
jgi:hypothetical protein